MRFITHNMLRCNIKNVGDGGYPLIIEAEKVESIPSGDYSPAIVVGLLRKLNFAALKSAAANLSLPDFQGVDAISEDMLADDVFLRKIHALLFELHVVEGSLICPVSNRRFVIKDSIPNMLLHEDELSS